jgi:CelD/BcsL family acetyltransferase involved in cellulose biosynthesis
VQSTANRAASRDTAQPAARRAPVFQVRTFSSLEELPAGYLRLFEGHQAPGLFLTLPWFRNFAATALDEGDRIRIYGVSPVDDPSEAACMFVARSNDAAPLRKLSALTSYYSCFFGLHLRGPGALVREILQALAGAIAAEKPRWDIIDIQPLDVDAEYFPVLADALRMSGFAVQTFFCFGNWYLPVCGRSYAQYVETLPTVVKNTLSRKRKKLEKSGRAKVEIITGGKDLETSIEAYTKVYLASWKRPEPYPKFIPGLIRMCAEMGMLRLGLVWVDGEAAAAQLWIVHNGAALIYKLAYDERFADLSVGTILTSTLMEQALDIDKVDEVDYGSGDDNYKKHWMSHRRERWGILAMNRRTPRGAMGIVRHMGGRAIKRAFFGLYNRLRNRGEDPPAPPDGNTAQKQEKEVT